MANPNHSKRDVYQEVTDSIIAQLESGTAPWTCPWNKGGAGRLPENFVSRQQYHGINTLLLWCEADQRGYSSNKWLTYKQAQEKGGQVRKGEKGNLVVFYKTLEKEREDGEIDRIPMMRHYHVFNVDQIDGIEDPQAAPEITPRTWSDCHDIEAVVPVQVRHDGARAYYSTSGDYIQMPEKDRFSDAASYYATLLHESTHATGHATRLDRQYGKRFGDSAYAREELVAEMGAAFLCATFGIQGNLQHAEYIDAWLKVLKADKKAVFTAAAAAQRAADYIMQASEQRQAA